MLKRSVVFAAGFLVFATIDVLSSSRDFIHTRSVTQMEAKPPVVTVLDRWNSRPAPRVVDLLPDMAPVYIAGADVIKGPWDRNRVSGEQLIQWGIPLALDVDYDLTYISGTHRARSLLSRIAAADPAEFGELIAQRSACALLVWKRPLTLEDPVSVVAIRGCRPEVDAVTAVYNFRGDDEFLRIASENRGRLARSVFAEGPVPMLARPLSEALVSKISSATESLSFETECASSCFVRVARTNDGNWKAMLDGKQVEPATVDLSLIGLPIPAGIHRIDLRYHDRLLEASIGISSLASLFAIGILLSRPIRRLKKSSST
jgi:hypothetical protein